MMLVVWFSMSTIDPVKNVKKSVCTHEEDIVARQVFDFAVTLQDNELRQNGNGFQVNRKGPKKFHDIKVLHASSQQMSNESDEQTRKSSEAPMQEGILRLVVGGLDGFLELDGVNDGSRGTNVQDLHYRVVNRVERRE